MSNFGHQPISPQLLRMLLCPAQPVKQAGVPHEMGTVTRPSPVPRLTGYDILASLVCSRGSIIASQCSPPGQRVARWFRRGGQHENEDRSHHRCRGSAPGNRRSSLTRAIAAHERRQWRGSERTVLGTRRGPTCFLSIDQVGNRAGGGDPDQDYERTGPRGELVRSLVTLGVRLPARLASAPRDSGSPPLHPYGEIVLILSLRPGTLASHHPAAATSNT
jgi:hypothetical protein